ncbi:MAG: protein GumC [Deltaproteobacteria bacterium]|nr:protein GumC [Deltaproteobacteria bacterium]
MSAAQTESLNIGYYLTLVSRRRWFIIVPFCLAMIVGMVLAVKLPKVYEANTLILVQPQRVPEKVVTPVVDSDIESRISTLSQQIMSRSNLERVMDQYKLFSDSDSGSMLMEDKLENLRKRIKVEVGRGARSRRDAADSFSVVYRDRNPQTAMRVANGLATFFIDENLKSREGIAVGTSDFLDAELESMRKRLEEQEQLLKKFREKNMGELPEQLDSNLRILDSLKSQLTQREDSLRSARVSLAALESEMSIRQGAIAAMLPPPGPSATGRENEDQMSLDQLKDKLAGLRASYTDQHPDVVRLKTRIGRLEKEQASVPPASDKAVEGGAATGRYASAQLNAEVVRQKTVLLGAIRAQEGEVARVSQEIRDHQRRIEATPRREQELLTIKRDYENIKSSYNSLLSRKIEADIAVNMEKKQKGEQFQVIDVARLPQKPISPDLPKLFMITIAAGIGLGAAFIFLLETMDTSVRRLDKLEEEIGLPVLAMVPRIFTSGDRRRHRMVMAATTMSIVVALALTSAFAVLVFNGVETTLELVRHTAGV